MRATLLLANVALLLATLSAASPLQDISSSSRSLLKRQSNVNYTNPNTVGGQMLTILPGNPGLGEPLNVIVSARSDPSILDVEGFLLWMTSVNMGVSCVGSGDASLQYADLGNGNQSQGNGDGLNGVLRWNYGDAYFGTCKETFVGGNHLRWFQQRDTKAWFLATSVELDLAQYHMIALNGYNNGRDEFVGNATNSNGTYWSGNSYKASVEYIPAGELLNATSEGVNHPSVALPGQPNQDGRVALLTVRQLTSANASANAGPRSAVVSLALLLLSVIAAFSILLA